MYVFEDVIRDPLRVREIIYCILNCDCCDYCLNCDCRDYYDEDDKIIRNLPSCIKQVNILISEDRITHENSKELLDNKKTSALD